MATLTLAFNLSNYMQRGADAFFCIGFFPKRVMKNIYIYSLSARCFFQSDLQMKNATTRVLHPISLNTIAFPVGLLSLIVLL